MLEHPSVPCVPRWSAPVLLAAAVFLRAGAEPPAKVALLVGIDRYAPGTPATIPTLSGCVRDVHAVREVLVERFGFAAEDVVLLEDAGATHEAIVRAFHDGLIERAGPATEALVWFSGHGSLAPDESGVPAAELDGLDSTLLAYDSRAHGEDGAFDLSDDELRSLVAALAAKTSRITVVTDACHSGGATRGALSGRVRGVVAGTHALDRERLKKSFWPAEIPLLEDTLELPGTAAHVQIAACGPRELAQEIDVDGEGGARESHGAFSFFLLQRLREAQPRTTYRQIADDVAVRVSNRCPAQTVWAEGALTRDLFGASFQELPPGFRARAQRVASTAPGGVGSPGAIEVQVAAGTVHGLRKGSVVALYAGADRAGRAEVVRAHAASSLARWIAPLPAEVPAGALRAVEETRPAGEEPLALHVPDPQIAALLAHSTRVRIVPGDGAAAEAEYELRAEDGGKLVLLGTGGVRIWEERERLSRDDGSLLARLEEEFREELSYRALLSLSEERGTLLVAAGFAAPTGSELEHYRGSRYARRLDANPRVEVVRGGSPGGGVYRANGTTSSEDELSLAILSVESRESRPIHVAVLSISEDRQRHAIWPPAGETDHVLAPGESVRIPVNVTTDAGWSAGRPMRDRYLVVATVEAADLTPLSREARPTRGDRPALPMPPLLSLALERPPTRGSSTDRSGFGIAVVDLYVDPIAKR